MRTPFEDIAESIRQRNTQDEESWRTNAPCTILPVDIFYTTTAEQGNDQILNTLCRRCPVIRDCLKDEFACVTTVVGIYGYRGGMSRQQRHELFNTLRQPNKKRKKNNEP